jgi:hypothetical protein
MDTRYVERAFFRMGARVKFGEIMRTRWNAQGQRDLALDVQRDHKGEFFLVRRAPLDPPELVVLDVEAHDRHLVLMSRKRGEKHRFLLGHDERHWFVAGIPESAPVTRVRDAMQALKPREVLRREVYLPTDELQLRHNSARVRQGEWFFVPARRVAVREFLILRNEPLVRSRGGKPHVCEELYRSGGATMYVHGRKVLTEAEYTALAPKQRHAQWRVMRRNPKVYVRGRVRHADHATIVLDGWHEVFTNTEHMSAAMRDVVFLD